MVQIKKLLGMTATAGGGLDIQKLDGATPPNPVGPKISLSAKDWARAKKLLDGDAKVADAADAANKDGIDDGSDVIWKP